MAVKDIHAANAGMGTKKGYLPPYSLDIPNRKCTYFRFSIIRLYLEKLYIVDARGKAKHTMMLIKDVTEGRIAVDPGIEEAVR